MEYLIYLSIIGALLLATAISDLRFRLIPVWLIAVLVIAVVSGTFFFPEPFPFYESLIGAGVVGSVVLFLYLLTKGRGIGEADIFLAAVIGFLFGWEKGLIVFSAANFLGLIVMIPLIALLGKERMRQIPLVAFIVLAIFLEWGFGYAEGILATIIF